MNTIIQARIDRDSKQKAEKILNQMGITLNQGIRMFLYQVINERALPFQPSAADEPSPAALAAIKEAEKELKDGNLPSFTSVDSLMTFLNED